LPPKKNGQRRGTREVSEKKSAGGNCGASEKAKYIITRSVDLGRGGFSVKEERPRAGATASVTKT